MASYIWFDLGGYIILAPPPHDLHEGRLRDVYALKEFDGEYFEVELVLEGPSVGREFALAGRHE